MRVFTLAAALALSACSAAAIGGGSGQAVTINVNVRPDSLHKAAVNYLTNAGFTATRLADSTLVTAPMIIPERARSATTQDQQWVLQIKSEKNFLMSGSRLRVAGFVVPPASNMPVDTTTVSRATPITTRNALLYNEVRAVADAIANSVGRR